MEISWNYHFSQKMEIVNFWKFTENGNSQYMENGKLWEKSKMEINGNSNKWKFC